MTPPIVQLAIAYGAGLWAGLVVSVLLAFVLLAPVVAPLCRSAAPGRWRAVLVAAALVGLVTGARLQHRPTCESVLPRGRVTLEVRTLDPADGRGRQPVRVLQGCEGDITLRTRDTIPAGRRATITGSSLGRGMVTVREIQVHEGRATAIPRLRAALARRIERLYGARAPLVEALVLGRRGDVDPELREAFVAAGLAHLLAISGLHVGLLASWVALLAGAVVGPRRAWAWAAAFSWAYVLMLGFPAPATRAATFVTLFGAAKRLGRAPPFTAVLAGGILAVLLIDPRAATSVGAWLSAAAVWGTASASRLVKGKPAPVQLLVVSIGATLATAPISAFAFGQVAPIGIAANLIAVPLASLAVPGVFASLLLGGPLAAGAGVVLAATERTAMIAAAIPGGHMVTVEGAKAAIPWLLLLAATVWLLTVRPRLHWLAPRVAALLAIVAWFPLVRPRVPASPSLPVSVFFLSVGQGDAIVIRTPHDRWLLIDAGPRDDRYDAGRDVVVPFLRRRGVRSLDAVFLSHGDMDHVGGMPAVLSSVAVDRVIEPAQPLGQSGYLAFLEAAEAAGVRWQAGRRGDTLRVDGITIAVLHPDAGWLTTELQANENSLVLHVSYGEFDLLLTGDAGLPMEAHLAALPRVEVLKVGHHGSASATGRDFLEALGPRLAVIPLGRNNRYRHPHPAVMARLAAGGVTVFRTDRDGMVTLTTDGEYFEVASRDTPTLFTRLLCALSPSRPSSPSSSSRSACTPRRAVNSPTSFTTWPSPARSSPATSGGPD